MDAKESVVDRLHKRHTKRIELLDKQRKIKEEINVSNEQFEYFYNIFKEKSNIIETSLNTIESLKENEIASHFDIIKRDLQDLQNFVAASSFFLKEFNIRKSQAVIQNLQTRCVELEAVYLPKKKFGFRNKGMLKKHVEIKPKSVDTVDNDVQTLKNVTWDITCGFSNKCDEKLMLDRENSFNKDVSLSHLNKCVIVIKGNPATLHIDNVTNSVILCGPISTSVFLEKCKDCELVLACQQLRCHSSYNCNIYLHVTSKAIIEDCHGIHVAPYNLKYEGIEIDYMNSSLDLNKNNWDKLDDFNWLAAGVSSPNWNIMDQNVQVSEWNKYI